MRFRFLGIILIFGFLALLHAEQNPTRIVFIAGKKSHGPGEHEYERGLRYLETKLKALPNVPSLQTAFYTNGWPTESKDLEGASTVVLYCDGSDHNPADHPLLLDDHLAHLSKLMEHGVGLVAIHYTVFVPTDKGGHEFLNWIGGYFDYEHGPGPNKWLSAIANRDFEIEPLAQHPVCAGVKPFSMKEEFYFQIRFPENRQGWTPLLGFAPDESNPAHVVAWCIERPNQGRGVGYTGGHYLKNFENPGESKFLINAILWTAHLPVQ